MTAKPHQPKDPLERHRRALARESTLVQSMGRAAQQHRITNATTDHRKPWRLFTPAARNEGEDHRRHPSLIGQRRVWLEDWGQEAAA